jgi:hypothetical protein
MLRCVIHCTRRRVDISNRLTSILKWRFGKSGGVELWKRKLRAGRCRHRREWKAREAGGAKTDGADKQTRVHVIHLSFSLARE